MPQPCLDGGGPHQQNKKKIGQKNNNNIGWRNLQKAPSANGVHRAAFDASSFARHGCPAFQTIVALRFTALNGAIDTSAFLSFSWPSPGAQVLALVQYTRQFSHHGGACLGPMLTIPFALPVSTSS